MKFLATILLVVGALIMFSAPIVEWRYIQVRSAFPDEASGRVYKRVVRSSVVYLTRAEYWLHEGQLMAGILVVVAGGLLHKRAKQSAAADA